MECMVSQAWGGSRRIRRESYFSVTIIITKIQPNSLTGQSFDSIKSSFRFQTSLRELCISQSDFSGDELKLLPQLEVLHCGEMAINSVVSHVGHVLDVAAQSEHLRELILPVSSYYSGHDEGSLLAHAVQRVVLQSTTLQCLKLAPFNFRLPPQRHLIARALIDHNFSMSQLDCLSSWRAEHRAEDDDADSCKSLFLTF